MCGIAGVFGARQPEEAAIARGLASMRHRGPDGRGRWQGLLGAVPLTLLHTRLAIVDLDPRASQPMIRDRYVVSYNGEIYNHPDLLAELESLGHAFSTTSDTEVLIEAWRRWGEGALDRLEGMWAFALADTGTGRLWLCRDRFGEKPLVWHYADGTLYFASETKTLAALGAGPFVADRGHVARFLVNGYRSLHKRDGGYFDGVQALPSATCAAFESPAPPAPRRYWTLAYRPQTMSRADAVAGVRAELRRAVGWRLRADVPIAFCLSGGIDSGTIAGFARQSHNHAIHTFSIVDRDPRYDESGNIGETVRHLGCANVTVHADSARFLERMEKLVSAHDAPVATISYYLHAFLSQAIARNGFKVALSGTGADELFTGYYDHYAYWLAGMAGSPGFERLIEQWRTSYGRYVRNPVLRDPAVFAANPSRRDHIYLERNRFNAVMREPVVEDFFEDDHGPDVLRTRMLNELQDEVVPVILHEDDLNSMAHSVENRSPFLDRRLAEFAYSIPSEHLIHDGYAKSVLRDAAAGLLPDRVRLDREKRGFNGSIDTLLDRRDPAVRDRLMASGPIWDIVDRERFAAMLDAEATDNSVSKFLFNFVSARLFLDGDLANGRVPVPAGPPLQ